MKKSENILKLILFTLLLLYPSFLYAHGEQIFNIALYSFAYFLFSGIVLGLVEIEVFRKYSDSKIEFRKIILFNYLILIFSYLIFLSFIIIQYNIIGYPTYSTNSMEDMVIGRRIAIIKLLVSIIIYFGIVIGLKYFIYRKRIFVESREEDLFLMIVVPNIGILGLFFCLTFENYVWIFGG